MKNLINNILKNWILIIVVMMTGLFLGWILFHSAGKSPAQFAEIEGHEDHDHESDDPQLWTCSMHPQIKQNEPGQCLVCAMDLIPLTTMSTVGDDVGPDEIVMTESAVKLASVQTSVVKSDIPEKELYLQGKVHVDERNITEITARFGGRIEELFVNFTGQKVSMGQKLATIFSPDLISAQRELIEAITLKESRPSLYNAALGKLRLWGLSDDQISEIEENGEPKLYFDLLSPATGTVTMRHIAAGDYVKEGDQLFKVIDLSRLWVLFDAYESDIPWISTGDNIEFTVQSIPGRKFSSKVTFIDPFIDATKRVAKVRVEIENPRHILKPEMFASGVIRSGVTAGGDQIIIPKSAVLWTGKRSVVYVKVPDREEPSFLYREIVLGPDAGDSYVVASGLEEGEEVVTNGVFKVDAAAQLIGLPSMMNPEGELVMTGHNHEEMANGGIKDH